MVEQINAIPRELLNLIPTYGGDKRQLNLFIRKCEYVVDRCSGDEGQNLYVFHSITCKLTDDAAALISEREDIRHWSQLKLLLQQHFGDPRTEECINIELETLKIKQDENYLDFCHRVQSTKSALLSKVNMLEDVNVRRAKATIYDNTALKVFLYNLPEDLVRVVRLKAPSTLEAALAVVLEEVNFHHQYSARNRMHNNQNATKPIFSVVPPQTFKFENNLQPSGFKMPPPIQNKFNLGISPSQNFDYRPPQLGYRPQFGNSPQLGFRPQFNNRTATQLNSRPQIDKPQYGYRPQIGYRPPFNSAQFGYRPTFDNQTQPSGSRPNLAMPPQQFGYKPPQINKPHFQASDVTMRTAPPMPREGFKLNELTGNDYQQCDYDFYCDNGYDDTYYYVDDTVGYDVDTYNDVTTDDYETSQTDLSQGHASVNFTQQASVKEKK